MVCLGCKVGLVAGVSFLLYLHSPFTLCMVGLQGRLLPYP